MRCKILINLPTAFDIFAENILFMKKLLFILPLFLIIQLQSQDQKLITGTAYSISTAAMGMGYTFSTCFENNGNNYIVAVDGMQTQIKLIKLDKMMNVVSGNDIPLKKGSECSYLNSFHIDDNLYVWYNYTESTTKNEVLVVKKINLESFKTTEKEAGSLTKKESRNGSGFEVVMNGNLKLIAGLVRHLVEEHGEGKLMHYSYTLDFMIFDKELAAVNSQQNITLKTSDEEKFYNCIIGNKDNLIVNTSKPNTPEELAGKTKLKINSELYKAHIVNVSTIKKIKVFTDISARGLLVKNIDDSCIAYVALKTKNGINTDAIVFSKLNFISQAITNSSVSNVSDISNGLTETTSYKIDLKTALNLAVNITDIQFINNGGFLVFTENSRKYSHNFGSASSTDMQDVSDYGPGVVMALDKNGSFSKVTLLDYRFDLINPFNDFGHGGYLQTDAAGKYTLLTYEGYVEINFSQELNELHPYKTTNNSSYRVLSDGKTVMLVNSKNKSSAFSRLE
jgi:hypothetical protein